MIHKFFNAQPKARVRQLRVELKSTEKRNKCTTLFVLRIKSITNSLIAVGDSILEQEQIDSILNGLPEKYNPFVTQMYESKEPPSLCDIKALLYVYETQLDKFRQELAPTTVAANLAHISQEVTMWKILAISH